MKKGLFVLFLCLPLLLMAVEVAEVVEISGEAFAVQRSNKHYLNESSLVTEGDTISVGPGSNLVLEFPDHSQVRIRENSILGLPVFTDREVKAHLFLGAALFDVKPQTERLFWVRTDAAQAQVKGTVFYVSVNDHGDSYVALTEGQLAVTSIDYPEDMVLLLNNQKTMVRNFTKPARPEMMTSYEMNEIRHLQGYEIPQTTVKDEQRQSSSGTLNASVDVPFENSSSSSGSEPKKSGWKPPFSLVGKTGSVQINDEMFTQIAFQTEFALGKVGVGLDINLLMDKDGKVRKEDWDESKDYWNKIIYVRYGTRQDPFFAKAGGFREYSLGNGLIFNSYSNMLSYPDIRKLGIEAGLNFEKFGVSGFVSDVTEPQILALNVQTRRFSSTLIPFMKNVTTHFTFGADLNEYKGICDDDGDGFPDLFDDFPHESRWHLDTDGDGLADDDPREIDADNDGLFDKDADSLAWQALPEHRKDYDVFYKDEPLSIRGKKEEVFILGAGLELPLVQRKYVQLATYADAAYIIDHGFGLVFPAAKAKLGFLSARAELRNFGDEFEPGFFDATYDFDRASVVGDTIITKKARLANAKAATGWLGALRADLFHFLYAGVVYEDMSNSRDDGRTITAEAGLNQTIIPQIGELKARYIQNNVEKIWAYWKTPNAYFEARGSYNLSNSVALVALYNERYVDRNGDGKIRNSDETVANFSITTEIRFF